VPVIAPGRAVGFVTLVAVVPVHLRLGEVLRRRCHPVLLLAA
jgi:hypothetical protein